MGKRTRDIGRSIAIACLLGMVASVTASAAVPHTMNYQGRLTTNAVPPVPVTASLPVVFSIWDSALGGAQLWAETWNPIAVTEGIFNVVLGSQVPLPSSLFTPGATRWLELTVNGEVLTPRQQLSSSSWAYAAEASETLGGVAAAGWQMRVNGTCPAGSSIRAVDAAGNVTCESVVGGIPSGAVLYFNLAACPSGWSELAAARGRYVVGLPAGGTLAGTGGTALSNLENRPVGQHSHTISDPGHAHIYVPPIQTGTGSGASSAKVGGATSTSSSTTGIAINNAGSVAGTNAPYIQLIVCQKN